MYKNKGNTKGREKRMKKVSAEKMCKFIAESIRSRIREGRDWSYSEYGVQDKPEMVELINSLLQKD